MNRRTFKRTVKNGEIIYAGFVYSSAELKDLEGKKVNVTKFGEDGSFDISKLLVDLLPEIEPFWVR